MREIFRKHKLPIARMVFASKAAYMDNHPDNDVLFNANVFTLNEKVWYGDLDLTLDSEKLQNVANESKRSLYVLAEKDGRFGNEHLKGGEVVKLAKKVFNPQLKLDL